MQMSKGDVSEESNSQIMLTRIPDKSVRQDSSPILSEEFFVVACCLLGTVITILMLVSIKILVKAFWAVIAAFQHVSNISVAVAVSVIILFLLIKLLQFGKQLVRAFWESLELD
jgi:hypothetical protein